MDKKRWTCNLTNAANICKYCDYRRTGKKLIHSTEQKNGKKIRFTSLHSIVFAVCKSLPPFDVFLCFATNIQQPRPPLPSAPKREEITWCSLEHTIRIVNIPRHSFSHAATFLFIFTAPPIHIAFNNVINVCHCHIKYILYIFAPFLPWLDFYYILFAFCRSPLSR